MSNSRALVAAAFLLAALSANRVLALEIIGHRGASYDAPENTVTSTKLAYAQGADASECDVYFTTDGKLVVMHDRNALRTTGLDLPMSQASSPQLRPLEAGQWGQWKGSSFSEKVPFLEELLAAVPEGKRIFVELESGPEMLPEVKRQLAASGLADAQVVIIGFNYEVVKQAKALMPQYQVLYLHAQDRQTRQYPPVESLIDKALAANLDGLDLYYEFPIDQQFVDKVRKAGLKLYTWTVDDADIARREAAAGVDGITTNRPRWLRDQLSDPVGALPLEQGFRQPPPETRPWVFWFWNNANITRDGITADLEAMQRVGIGGVLIMDVVERFAPPPGTATYMSPEWRRLISWTLQEAARLGMEVSLANGPGWTGSSGAWITPEHSMQKLVWTSTPVTGPTRFSSVLPVPSTGKAKPSTDVHVDPTVKVGDFYADVAVLAFPANTSNVAEADVINLTGQFEPDGHLRWQAPPGDWIVQRIGHTTTGKTTRPPVAGASGLECDKLSRQAMDLHFRGMLGPIIEAAGSLAGTTLAATHIDSWEAGPQTWTPRLPEEFLARRGYDPVPFLPTLLTAGRPDAVHVGGAERADRFQWDLQQTFSELLAENYVGHLAKLANAHGLRLSVEGYNLKTFGDEATYTARADEPMSEFWTPSEWGQEETRRKGTQMASVAHTTGKKVVGAEAFTSGLAEEWRLNPALIKGLGDEQFARGVNKFVFHRYAHQPYLDRAPGVTMGPWGLHYERTQTWWELSTAWHQYLSRCQFMLRRGLFVADLCYLRPEQPHQKSFDPLLPPPAGYRYDEISVEALLERAGVSDGRLVLPDGMSYRLLVVPPVETMTPRLARKLRDLVAGGATVVVNAPPPQRSPSLQDYPACDAEVSRLTSETWGRCNGADVTSRTLGNGRLVRGQPLAQVLADMATPPDFTADATVNWIHRRDAGQDIFFVANRWPARLEVKCHFRVKGMEPELWNPETGTITRLAVYEPTATGVSIPLHLDPSGSTFVVFRTPANEFDPIVSFTRDGKSVFSPAKPVLVEIRNATYGPPGDSRRRRHVEAKVRSLTGEGFTPFRVSEMAGDGPGRVPWKTLEIDYTVEGRPHRATGQDPDVLTLATPCDAAPRPAEISRDATGALRIEATVPGRYELKTAGGKTLRADIDAPPAPLPITGPWRVRFDPGRGAPPEVSWDTLSSWTESPDPGIKYFSGTATYTATFRWAPPAGDAADPKVRLDLGDVQVMARVQLNGQDLGICWKPPFQVDVTASLKPGENQLEVTVANLWPNRMIGDAALPESKRTSWSTWQPFTSGTPLLPSGLLGPVRLVYAQSAEYTQPAKANSDR